MMNDNFMDGLGRGIALIVIWISFVLIIALLGYRLLSIAVLVLPIIFIIANYYWTRYRLRKDGWDV